jgi:hypothetical protein
MRPNVLIGQMMVNHKDCLLNVILGIGIGKGKVSFSSIIFSFGTINASFIGFTSHYFSSLFIMGWNDPWAHTPSYFRPYHVEYAAVTPDL